MSLLCCFLESVPVVVLCILVVIFFLVACIFKPKPINVRFANSHTIITGGSSGIGLSVAACILKRYGKNGAVVTLVARNIEKLENAKRELVKTTCCNDEQIQIFSCDVTNYDELSRVVTAACEQCQICVTVLVCSAGITAPRLIQDTTSTQFKNILDVNVLGSFNAAKAVLPFMAGISNAHKPETDNCGDFKTYDEVAQRLRNLNGFKAGSENVASNICLLSSQAGCIGLIGYCGYSSSKFALRGLAESLQMELRPYNVSFTLSHPPDTQTPSLEKENEERSALLREIAETSCLWDANSVAQKIVSDISDNVFLSHFGIIGWLLSLGTAACSPVHSIGQFGIEVLLAGIARFAVLFFQWDFDMKIKRALRKLPNTNLIPDKKEN